MRSLGAMVSDKQDCGCFFIHLRHAQSGCNALRRAGSRLLLYSNEARRGRHDAIVGDDGDDAIVGDDAMVGSWNPARRFSAVYESFASARQ